MSTPRADASQAAAGSPSTSPERRHEVMYMKWFGRSGVRNGADADGQLDDAASSAGAASEVLEIGGMRLAIALAWTVAESTSEGRRFAGKNNAYLVKDVGGETVAAAGGRQVIGMLAGGAVVGHVVPNAFVYHPLPNHRFWICLIRDGVPYPCLRPGRSRRRRGAALHQRHLHGSCRHADDRRHGARGVHARGSACQGAIATSQGTRDAPAEEERSPAANRRRPGRAGRGSRCCGAGCHPIPRPAAQRAQAARHDAGAPAEPTGAGGGGHTHRSGQTGLRAERRAAAGAVPVAQRGASSMAAM